MLIFLDLETTGLEKEDEICSIGLIAIDNNNNIVKNDIVNQGKKIPPKASSINHITNEMLKDKPNLKDCETYKFLLQNNKETTTMVAHNIKFDLEKLLACGFGFKGEIIDTLRVTKHLIPECEEFSLQLLRYELRLYRDEKKVALECGIKNELFAHNVLSDALTVRLLYEYLLQISTREEMANLTFKKVLMQKFNFGKYSGKYIEEIAMIDRGYLEWMLSGISDLDEDLQYSLKHYLEF